MNALLGALLDTQKMACVGLDVGSGAVKAVRLVCHAGQWTAEAADYAEIEPSEDAALHRKNTITAINRCFKDAGIKGSKSAVCGLAGPEVVIRNFLFPQLPDAALEQAARFEAQQVSALDINHSVVDYQLMEDCGHESAKGKRRGYLVAALEEAISRRLEMVQETDVHVLMMDINNLAALNCVCQLAEKDSDDGFAVLDVGHTQSNLSLLGADGSPFTRDLTFGAGSLTCDMSKKLGLTLRQIQDAFAKESLEPAIEMELASASSKFVADVVETLRFYGRQPGCGKIQRVHLCGGLAAFKCWADLLTEHLPISVSVFNPFSTIVYRGDSDRNHKIDQFGPAFTVAAGLAMRTLE